LNTRGYWFVLAADLTPILFLYYTGFEEQKQAVHKDFTADFTAAEGAVYFL